MQAHSKFVQPEVISWKKYFDENPNLSKMKNRDLKEVLKHYKLHVTGKKSILVDRIVNHFHKMKNAVKLQSENIEAKAKPLENGTVYKPEKESDEILKSYIKIINKIKILNTKTTDIEKTNKNNKDIKYYSLLMKRYINTVYSSKNKKNKIYKEIEEKIKKKLTQRDIRYYNRLHHIEKLYTMVNFKTL